MKGTQQQQLLNFLTDRGTNLLYNNIRPVRLMVSASDKPTDAVLL
jgi:hypothetical protein